MLTRLLIDGYNLLHASDVFVAENEPATLERTRLALLGFLAEHLDERQRTQTTVVFDAAQAPPGLPHQLTFARMTILFSRRPQHADDLLEDILASARGTRECLVISSDHRVQRAARQRGAAWLDSEQWLRDLKSQTDREQRALDDAKPAESSWESSPDLQLWLDAFSTDVSAPAEKRRSVPEPKPLPAPQPEKQRNVVRPPIARTKPSRPPRNPTAKTDAPPPPDDDHKKDHRKKDAAQQDDDNKNDTEKDERPAWNPFPPGYGEDLLSDE